ncbi:MAG: outer membrane protein assembly factor BamB family protein, partial [Planctomycetota bacterium]
MQKLIALAIALLLAGSLQAEDTYWNQFRGPNGDGASTAKNLPVEFSEDSKALAWKTPVTGRAWSSPVIWGNQVWLTNAPEIENPEGVTAQKAFTSDVPLRKDPIELSAVCLDLKTGRKVHDLKVFDVFKIQFTHPTNSYASPTPYIEDGRIYVHFGAYGTACLDTATGKKIWERRDIECDHWRGPGSSPVVHGDLLFLCF